MTAVYFAFSLNSYKEGIIKLIPKKPRKSGSGNSCCHSFYAEKFFARHFRFNDDQRNDDFFGFMVFGHTVCNSACHHRRFDEFYSKHRTAYRLPYPPF